MRTAWRKRHTEIGLAILAAACILGLSETAEARSEQLRWQHGNRASVASFTVHVGTSPGVYTQQVNVGKPTFQNGAYVYNLNVADTASVYVSISARGTNGLTSSRSNERFRPAPQGPPPTTPPPTTPPPSGGLGAPGRPVVVSP